MIPVTFGSLPIATPTTSPRAPSPQHRAAVHTGAMTNEIRRQRDPDRKARILAAAADLAGRTSFHDVSMADIGAEAGIVGSGIYRHFDSKTSILIALLDRVMNRISSGAEDIAKVTTDDSETLSALVSDHIRIAIDDRNVLAVYHREVDNLPEEDRRRLRRLQRLYIEEWVHVLAPLRPDLTDQEARLTVHAAIGAIQSTLNFNPELPNDRLAELLGQMAHACLGVDPARTPRG